MKRGAYYKNQKPDLPVGTSTVNLTDPLREVYLNEYLRVLQRLQPFKVGDIVTLTSRHDRRKYQILRMTKGGDYYCEPVDEDVDLVHPFNTYRGRKTHAWEMLPEGALSFGQWIARRVQEDGEGTPK